MNSEFSELARVFNKNAFEDILEGDFSYARDLNKFYFKSRNKTLGEFYEQTYKILLKNYKNEYVFKNLIAQKIVIGKHRLVNIALFNEFKVWNKYVDIVIVNGCTTAYEIKTEFDSYSRLKEQLIVYTKVFEYVNLVIPEKKINDKLWTLIPNNVGLLVLTERNTLIEYKESRSNLENLSQEMIFSCLRRREYEGIVEKVFGNLPNVKQVYMRSKCLELFKQVSNKDLNIYFKEILKNRNQLMNHRCYLNEVPISLKSIALTKTPKIVEKIIEIANTELY